MFLLREQDDIVSRIEHRIASYTMIPLENGEGFQVNPKKKQCVESKGV